jgi:para-nitrobenzyl esterase
MPTFGLNHHQSRHPSNFSTLARRGALHLLATSLCATSLLVLFGCQPTAETAIPVEPIADTSYGQVRGLHGANGIYAFKNIPYGASTAGTNRFKPPQPPAAWDGVFDATEYRTRSPQAPLSEETSGDYGRMIRWYQQPGEMSEDCLNLNVWTPGLDDAARPVMVSFHGGGFTSGTGNGSGYVGDPLATFGDVVVVTVNHRLGVMGFLHLGDVGGEEYAQSGNAGVLDLVAALEWVRNNIANFGGDPKRVMIWGQSGGGAKTSTLLAMPSAAGLFHRAAVQSGSSLRMRTREEAVANTEELLAQLKIEGDSLELLQEMTFEELVEAQIALGPRARFSPVVDGEALPRHPFDPDAPEISRDVPMIIGFTLDDAALSLTNWDLDEAGLAAAAQRIAGDRGAEVLTAYRAAYPDATPYLVQARMATDARFGRGALEQARLKAEQGGAPAYLYLWKWQSPGMGGKFGAVHGVDVGLAFHNAQGEIVGDGTNPEALRLADELASAWVAFARTGNPNNPQLPEWPQYDPQTKPTMIFDVTTRVEDDPLAALRVFWE